MAVFTKDKSYYRSLIMLALPIALQQLVTFAVAFADNLMVGTLGDLAISGVYMGNQIQTVLQLTLAGVAMGMSILITQYWGKKDYTRIKTIIAIAFRFALLLGLVLSAVSIWIPDVLLSFFTNDADVIATGASYLRILSFSYVFFCISQMLVAAMRCVEKPRIGLMLSVVTLVVNVSLNYILIFGKLGCPALGIEGAALATLLSRIVEAGVMIWYVLVVDKKLHLVVRDVFRRDKLLLHDLIRYGIPVVAGDFVWAINTLAQSAILGRLNAEAITATAIAVMLSNLAYVWMTGLGSAVAIITGKTVGAGRYELMKEYAKTTQVLFILVGIATGIVLSLIRIPFLTLYNVSDQAAIYANQMMWVVAITMIGSAYQAPCLAGLVKAGGDTGFVFKNDTIFVFLVVLPSGLITLLLGAPAWVVFACLKCDQILKCFVALVKINSFNWMKNLTRTEDGRPVATVGKDAS